VTVKNSQELRKLHPQGLLGTQEQGYVLKILTFSSKNKNENLGSMDG
jgi:hypothetical protein